MTVFSEPEINDSQHTLKKITQIISMIMSIIKSNTIIIIIIVMPIIKLNTVIIIVIIIIILNTIMIIILNTIIIITLSTIIIIMMIMITILMIIILMIESLLLNLTTIQSSMIQCNSSLHHTKQNGLQYTSHSILP